MSESDEEYADSVRDIEHAPKVNYHKWTALVASFILIAGLGGAVFYNIRNSVSEPMYSDTDSSVKETEINTTSVQKAVELNCEVNFSIRTAGESKTAGESSVFKQTSDYRFYETNFGRLPDIVVNEISEKLQNCDWIEMNEDSTIDYSASSVIISYAGKENFVCTVSENGYVVIEDDNGKRYCENNIYYDIFKFIAYNLPYCDWTTIVGGEAGTALDTAFKNHADEIVLDGYSNAFILPSEVKKGIGLKFFEDSIFTGYVDEKGKLYFRYKNIDSEDGIIRHALIQFSSSPELYSEIAEIVNAEEEHFENTNEELFSYIDKNIEGGEPLFYKSEKSFTPVMFGSSGDMDVLC
ncbi:MAG: hypothetical protein K2H19_09180, partial [Ruminococcus sp.]|nr:hypothetical protein [Ruminococcus sp.]